MLGESPSGKGSATGVSELTFNCCELSFVSASRLDLSADEEAGRADKGRRRGPSEGGKVEKASQQSDVDSADSSIRAFSNLFTEGHSRLDRDAKSLCDTEDKSGEETVGPNNGPFTQRGRGGNRPPSRPQGASYASC